MRTRTRHVIAGLLAAAALAPGRTADAGDAERAAAGTATLHGELRIGLDGLSLQDAGEIVVFLEPQGPDAATRERALAARARPPETIRQSGARFEPRFLAVSRGQSIAMPNDDVIYHNVFSYSEPNDFDLGLYAAGESHAVRFEHAGLVRIYCSIHDEMDGLIFVAPNPLLAVPGSTGRYAIEDVPPGDYRLRVWSERLPEVIETLQVGARTATRHDVVIGLPDPAR